MLLPPALGFSPHLPVSVYGTGTVRTIAAFLGTWLTRFPTLLRSASRLRIVWRICLPYSYLACTRLSFPRPCSPHTSPQFCLTAVQESPPAVHRLRLPPLALGPRLTQGRSALPWKPWIFGREDSHLSLATHSGILSSRPSTAPSGTASPSLQCSSTNDKSFLSFGVVFQPRTFSAQDLSTSELLRTL